MWFNGFKSGTDFRWDSPNTVLAPEKKSSSLTWISGLEEVGLACYRHMSTAMYVKCSKISNTLKLRTPKIIAENNFQNILNQSTESTDGNDVLWF